MSDRSAGVSERRFHHPLKPLDCPTCGAHVVVLSDGECLECHPEPPSPGLLLIENDWSPERFPDEVRDLHTGNGRQEGEAR